MKTISLKVPDTLDARLEEVAQKGRLKKSEIVRRAVAAYLAKGPRARRSSFLEQARDLAGCVDGPVDLSTSKRHMKGYGQ